MVTACIVLYSVRLVGNNSLIHLLRILTSLELFLIMNFIPSIQFWLMCTIMVRLFCSFESVFELAGGLRDSQTSINNKGLGLKKKAQNICKDNIWPSFLCVLALSSVICRPNHLFYASVGFQKYQKIFNQKIYPRERCDSNKCFVLPWVVIKKNLSFEFSR